MFCFSIGKVSKGYRFLFHFFQTFFQSLHAFSKRFQVSASICSFRYLLSFSLATFSSPFNASSCECFNSPSQSRFFNFYLRPVYIRKLYIHIVPIPAGILIHHDILYILQSHITFQINKFQSSCTIYNHNQLLHLFPLRLM